MIHVLTVVLGWAFVLGAYFGCAYALASVFDLHLGVVGFIMVATLGFGAFIGALLKAVGESLDES
jgi:hypothetical protein